MQNLRCLQVLNNIIWTNGVVIQNIVRDLFHGPEINLVNKQQIIYSFRMIKHSSLILFIIDIKLLTIFEPCPHIGFWGNILVHHRYMCRNTRMQPADNFVKNGLLLTCWLGLIRLSYIKTVLFIYQFPYGFAIIIRIRLYVFIQVKVLAFIILLVLYMPDPIHCTIRRIPLTLP